MEQFAHAQHGAKPEKLHVLKMEHAADMGLRRPYRPQFFNLVLQIKSLITSNAEPLGVNMRLWFESRTDMVVMALTPELAAQSLPVRSSARP